MSDANVERILEHNVTFFFLERNDLDCVFIEHQSDELRADKD